MDDEADGGGSRGDDDGGGGDDDDDDGSEDGNGDDDDEALGVSSPPIKMPSFFSVQSSQHNSANKHTSYIEHIHTSAHYIYNILPFIELCPTSKCCITGSLELEFFKL